jgi:hypothetical protein
MARVREEARALTINNSTAHSCAYLPSLARVCARSNSHRASRRAAGPDACHHGALCVPAGTLHHICQALAPSLLNPKLQDVRVVYFTSQDPRDVTNAIYLLGAFLCLRLGATPEEAWGPFQSLKDMSNGPLCLPNRDATWTKKLVRSARERILGRSHAGCSDRPIRSPDLRQARGEMCSRCALHLAAPSFVPWPAVGWC